VSARLSAVVHTGPESFAASCTMGIDCLYSELISRSEALHIHPRLVLRYRTSRAVTYTTCLKLLFRGQPALKQDLICICYNYCTLIMKTFEPNVLQNHVIATMTQASLSGENTRFWDVVSCRLIKNASFLGCCVDW
jgi:hypothetical protein